ncbi:MAG: hypothetical protein PHY93_05820 [Bacteriovorax sp.]|nr:hypothetical protein [Bacteriovorax sp.]
MLKQVILKNLESLFLRWTNFSDLQAEEVKHYWENLEFNDVELSFAVDESNECHGFFCNSKGAGFNLFVENPIIDWSFHLNSLFNKNVSFVTISEISNNLGQKFKISQRGLVGLATIPIPLKNCENLLSFDLFHQDRISEVSIFLQNLKFSR